MDKPANSIQADYLGESFSKPNVRLGSVVFGLPDLNSHDYENKLEAYYGMCSFTKANHVCMSGCSKPLTRQTELNFVTPDKKILNTTTNETISLSEIKGNCKKKIIFCGGYHYANATEEPVLKKCLINFPEGFFLLDDGTKVPFHMCHVALEYRKQGVFKYEVEVVPLTTIEPFCYSEKLSGFAEVTAILTTMPIPNVSYAYKAFLSSDDCPKQVSCADFPVSVPVYLQSLFGKKSPVFSGTTEKFGIKCTHEPRTDGFILLVKWLKHLVMKEKFPSCDELIAHDMNIDEWIYIANYFDIPVFEELFGKIKGVIESLHAEQK